MRLFIAAALPDSVKDELLRVQGRIVEDDIPTRRVKRDAMHLTFTFLGDVTKDKIDAMTYALNTIAFSPIETSLSGLGAFPDKKHARVIWAGLNNEVKLRVLAEKIQDAMHPFGYRPDHPFSAHLTICRIKDARAKDRAMLQEKLRTMHINPIRFTISSFFLIQSTLMPDGPAYTILGEFSAKKPEDL